MRRQDAEQLEQWCVRTVSECWHGFSDVPLLVSDTNHRGVTLRYAARIISGGHFDRLALDGPAEYEEAAYIQVSERRLPVVLLAWEAIVPLDAGASSAWLNMIYGKETL